jgi:hypothetical protein
MVVKIRKLGTKLLLQLNQYDQIIILKSLCFKEQRVVSLGDSNSEHPIAGRRSWPPVTSTFPTTLAPANPDLEPTTDLSSHKHISPSQSPPMHISGGRHCVIIVLAVRWHHVSIQDKEADRSTDSKDHLRNSAIVVLQEDIGH